MKTIKIYTRELNKMLEDFYNLKSFAEPILDNETIYIYGDDEIGYRIQNCCGSPYSEELGYTTNETLEDVEKAICENYSWVVEDLITQ